MPDSIPNNWEPDPRQVGKNWQDMFRDPQRNGQPTSSPVATEELPDDAGGAIDLTEYKPWIVQRVRSRPALMLELRRYEPRSGLWQGWAMPYHSLYAIEYTGECLLSLDFGSRQFILEGHGIIKLSENLINGTVISIREYSEIIWNKNPSTDIISSIRNI